MFTLKPVIWATTSQKSVYQPARLINSIISREKGSENQSKVSILWHVMINLNKSPAFNTKLSIHFTNLFKK